MSNSPDDKDGWSQHSASLFREARRAHDPTPLERARLDAVLQRIQAANPEASLATKQASDVAARSTGALLGQIGKISLAVVCVAAVAMLFVRANRQPSKPEPNDRPAPTVEASAPTVEASAPTVEASAPTPASSPSNAAPSALPHIPAAQDEREPAPRSQRRRARAIAEVQRAPRTEAVAAPRTEAVAEPEPAKSAPDAAPVRVTAPSTGSPASPAAATEQESSARATPVEPKPQEPEVAAEAREVQPPTELALLKRMHAALREADYSRAIALCAEHERRWPHGVFEFEREGVRAIAACGAKSADAIPRAKRFLATHPHAPIAMRVSSACVARLPK